jgi:hypothetical protein
VIRLPDWKASLCTEIDAAHSRPVAWGTHDCLQFVARCVQAMTGENPAASYPAYDSEDAAYQLVSEHGGITAMLTAAFGEPVAPNLAHVGDVVVANFKGRETGGICIGTNCVFAGTRGGISSRSRECILRAWKI